MVMLRVPAKPSCSVYFEKHPRPGFLNAKAGADCTSPMLCCLLMAGEIRRGPEGIACQSAADVGEIFHHLLTSPDHNIFPLI
jgi:hypothetical protein